MGWAIRIGMLTTVVGSAIGGLMTSPTHAQLAAARETHRLMVAGAHTVGAPDGGPGMPGTGWSREHGDLRVPHFIGLHGVQILPGIAWLITGLSAARRRRLVLLAGVSYGTLFLVLLAQALAGQPVLGAHGLPGAALAAWLVATTAGTLLALSARQPDIAREAAAPLAVL